MQLMCQHGLNALKATDHAGLKSEEDDLLLPLKGAEWRFGKITVGSALHFAKRAFGWQRPG